VACTLNCADNSGAKSLYIISTYGIHGRLNKLPSASIGDMVLVSVRKGKPEMRKKGSFFPFWTQNEGYLGPNSDAGCHREAKKALEEERRSLHSVRRYFRMDWVDKKVKTDNAGVIVNLKGEMKGSSVTGPVAKECSELWPKIASKAGCVV
jgi:large subunit ribosomal protein L23e